MKRLIPVCLTVLLAVPWLYAQQGPGAFSTLQTTDTTANSLLVGCAVGSTTCTGGVKAGPISGTTISGTTISGTNATLSTGTTGANLVTTGNTAAGTGNYAGYWLKNDEAVTSAGAFIQTSSTYNTAPSNPYDPMNVASATQVIAPRSGGFALNAENGPIGFYTAHVQRWGINAAGDLVGASSHIVDSAGTPTITSGAGSGATIVGTDSAFKVTIGTGAGGPILVTFGHAFTNAPTCVAGADSSAAVTVRGDATTSQVTLTSTAYVSAVKFQSICRGY